MTELRQKMIRAMELKNLSIKCPGRNSPSTYLLFNPIQQSCGIIPQTHLLILFAYHLQRKILDKF